MTNEQVAAAVGISVEAFSKLSPANRIAFFHRAERGTHIPDSAKVAAVKADSELRELERRLARLDAAPAPRFAGGREQHGRTISFIKDRIAGIRRRLDQPS